MKYKSTTFPAAPEFPRNATWLNSNGLTLQSLAGKVVLLHFWDYTNINCLEAMPYLRAWHAKYEALGVVLVGVHTPEFPFARSRGAVRMAVTALELHHPILLDNKFELWKAYNNTFWPSYHLIDEIGALRYSDVGEGAWLGVESVLQDLIRGAGLASNLPGLCKPLRPRDEPGVPHWPVTGNVYTGYERGSIGNSEGSDPHRVVYYEEAEAPLKEGSFYLEGKWLNHRFCAAVAKAAEGTEASIHVPYTAAEVNMVVNPSGDQGFLVDVFDNREPLTEANAGPHVRIAEDGERRSQVLIHDPKMYRVIKHDRVRSGVLKITARSSGFTVYAFTFLSSPFQDGMETPEFVTALIDGTAAPSMEASVLSVVPADPAEAEAAQAAADAEGAAAGDQAGGKAAKPKRAPRAPKGKAKAAAESAPEEAAASAPDAEPAAEVVVAPAKKKASRAKTTKAATKAKPVPALPTAEPPAAEPVTAQAVTEPGPDAASSAAVDAPAPAEPPTAKTTAKTGARATKGKAKSPKTPRKAAGAKKAAATQEAADAGAQPVEAKVPEAQAADAEPADAAVKGGTKKAKRGRATPKTSTPDEPRILLQLSRPRKRTTRRTARAKDGDAASSATKPSGRKGSSAKGTNGEALKAVEPAKTQKTASRKKAAPAADEGAAAPVEA